MTNEDTQSKKEKILIFIKENKIKSFMIIAFIVVFAVVVANKKDKKINDVKDIKQLYVSKDNTDELYKAKYLKDIDPKITENKKDIDKIQKQLDELAKENKDLKKQVIDTVKGTYGDVLNSNSTYQKDSLTDTFNKNLSNNNSYQPPIPPLNKGVNSNTPNVSQGVKVQYVEWEKTAEGNDESSLLLVDENLKAQAEKDSKKTDEKKFKMIIPSGTLMLVKLDNGMHLSTLSMGKSSTTPVTATLVSEAFMPNGRTFDMKGAKMVLEGVGSLSSERGYIKPLRISGFNAENETFDLPIQGYVSDVRTGIQGIQGEIISKQESLFWSSLVAYTLQGIGKGVAGSQQIMTTSAFGTTTTTPPDKILGSSLANGVGEGAKEVGNSILEIAKQIEPIVEILGNQYAIVHTTYPFTLEYRIDESSSYNQEIPVVKSVDTDTSKKVDSIVKGMKK